MKIKIGFISLLLLISIIGYTREATAQEIVRLELEASNLNLPFYTIPLGEEGVLVFRGAEIRNRRVVGWELIHYDVFFTELYKHRISSDRGAYFSGWEVGTDHVNILFLMEQSRLAGEVFVYSFRSRQHHTIIFGDPGLTISNAVFTVSGSSFYLTGINERPGSGFSRLGQALRGERPAPELLIISGFSDSSTVKTDALPVTGLIDILKVQSDPSGDGILIAAQVTEAKYSVELRLMRYRHDRDGLKKISSLTSNTERYLADVCFIRADDRPLALAGTYGSRERRAWRRGEPVFAEGIFFSFLEENESDSIRFYPFTQFKNLSVTLMQSILKRSRSTGRMPQGRGSTSYRMLLHEQPYIVDQNLIIVGEAYYPEFEYDARPQHYYYPYSYYGFYPGFYDTGSRWIFKGFRYEHAVIAAFDENGNLVWDNSLETSNILEKSLNPRLRLLPYDDEMVLVYAHEGRIWFRVIKRDDVLVEKDSYPLELPSLSDRVREHYSMNMMPWYDRYFVVYGRQSIRGSDGRTRVVYYCNKLEFE